MDSGFVYCFRSLENSVISIFWRHSWVHYKDSVTCFLWSLWNETNSRNVFCWFSWPVANYVRDIVWTIKLVLRWALVFCTCLVLSTRCAKLYRVFWGDAFKTITTLLALHQLKTTSCISILWSRGIVIVLVNVPSKHLCKDVLPVKYVFGILLLERVYLCCHVTWGWGDCISSL